MTQHMAIWLIFATLVTLGVTALLIAVLYRINLADGEAPSDGRLANTDGHAVRPPKCAANGQVSDAADQSG